MVANETKVVDGRVGLVTVTFNGSSVIHDFMTSVLAQDHRDFVLYVIDNASADDTLEKIASFPCDQVRVIQSGANVGVAAGNNSGIAAALADGCSHILLVNNDTLFGGSLLSLMLKEFAELGAQMLVPKITFYEHPSKIWCAGGGFDRKRGWSTFHYGEGQEDVRQFETARRLDYAPTCCMLIAATVFETVGMMDERYFVYSDDADFCFRAKILRIPLWYTPVATLAHKVSSSTGGANSPFTIHYGTRNRVFFMRKNLPRYQTFIWLLAYQFLFHARLLAGIDSKSVYCMRQRAWRAGLNM